MSSESKDAAPKTEVEETSAFWFSEFETPDMELRMRLKRIMFDGRSAFQHVQVIETSQFGKTLVLDGKTQSARMDEFIYHESLVHPAMLLHPAPKTVYIGGGGEMATAREVLRHKSVEKVVMVDIDETVVKYCLSELPEWGDGCMEDPRLEVHYTDAKKWLEESDMKFDVVIMDIADPIEAGPGIVLYTEEFYKFLHTRLNAGGIFVTQSGPGSFFNVNECFTTINRTLARSFSCVVPYTVDIPSFGSNWGFNLAFNVADGEDADAAAVAVTLKDVASVDGAVADRINGSLRFYDGITHRGIFGLPKPVRDAIAAETRVMTIDNPVFMF